MKNDILLHNGKKLVPVQIDPHTWVLLPPERATKKNAQALKKRITESRMLAIRSNHIIKDFEY